jgi:hypothetical protein
VSIPSSDLPKIDSTRPTAPPNVTKPASHCANCGAGVSGKYCSACGQTIEFHLHSLWDLLQEAAEVLTHADSRLWRTLGPLVVRPGFLTQQFLAGCRASYLSPFRLYFVISVLFFLVVSMTGQPASRPGNVAAAVPSSKSDGARGLQDDLRRSTDSKMKMTAAEFCEGVVGHSLMPGVNKMREPFVSACIKSQADNGQQLRENFIRNMGRAMFLFLPVLAAFTKLLYWRPQRSYVTHLLLLIHNHAFVFLLMALVLAVMHLIHPSSTGLPAFMLMGYLIYYLFQSMRRVYGENWWRTLIKFATLSVGYLACAVCTLLLAGLYSAETL